MKKDKIAMFIGMFDAIAMLIGIIFGCCVNINWFYIVPIGHIVSFFGITVLSLLDDEEEGF